MIQVEGSIMEKRGQIASQFVFVVLEKTFFKMDAQRISVSVIHKWNHLITMTSSLLILNAKEQIPHLMAEYILYLYVLASRMS